MKAKSIKGNTPEEIKTALLQSISAAFKPTLAIVFISINNDSEEVNRLLDEMGIRVFGATSSGEFIDEEISHGAIAILLMDMNPAHFKILLHDYRDKDPEEIARQMAAEAKTTCQNPSFIVSVSIHAREETELFLGEPLIKAIESVTGKETVIWGGRAGDDFAFNETIVFTNQLSTKRGIIMLVLDGDKILIKGAAASGQKPVGTEKIITKAIGNSIYELDHQPAADIVLKYLGLNLTPDEAEVFYPAEGLAICVSRDKGDPVMRGVGMFNWKTRSFHVLGNIHEGEKIRLTLPPDFQVIDEVNENAEKIKLDEMPDADALVMFSCVGRLGQFGPLIGDEIEGVRKAFNVPMVGFFTYGEFGRTKNGNNDFHASTCCWVALKEK
jgi:hypothetical protein